MHLALRYSKHALLGLRNRNATFIEGLYLPEDEKIIIMACTAAARRESVHAFVRVEVKVQWQWHVLSGDVHSIA